MQYLLLIAEPVGQRAERTEAEGRAVYQRMLDYAAGLQTEGVLRGVASLLSPDRGVRVQRRDGRLATMDGPFSEAKEMIGGYFLVECETPQQAVDIAARCPAAEWATVEVRPVGPCWA